MCAQLLKAHSWRRTRGTAANVGAVERVGSVGRDDRVEDQRFDVFGVILGVLERDLGAVGGAVEHELFVAAGDADRFDVGDAVGGRVEGAFGADLAGARRDQRAERAERAGVFEAVAGERVREAGAALVVDDQVARREHRAEDFGEVFGERHRRLSGAARQRDDGRGGVADGRAVAADRERDRAR